MPISLICGACEAKLTAPDAAAGKRVKCRQCGAVLDVPELEPQAEPDFEVIEEAPTMMLPTPPLPRPTIPSPPPAAKPQPPKAKPKPVVLEESDDEDDRPAPKKKQRPAVEADDEDDRPTRKKKPAVVEGDDEDDAPRGKKGKKKPPTKGGALPLMIGGGVLGLALVGFLVYWFALREPEVAKAPPVANPNPPIGGPGDSQPNGSGSGGFPADPFAGAPRLQPITQVKLPDGFQISIDSLSSLSTDGMRFSIDGRVQFNKRTYVVDLSGEGKVLGEFKGSALLTPRGDAVVSRSFGGSVLNLSDKRPRVKEDIHFTHLEFVGEETMLYTTRSDNFRVVKPARITIRDINKGVDLASSFEVPDNRFEDVRLTDNGTRLWLFMGANKFEVECWDVPGKRLLKTVRPEQVNPVRPYTSSGGATAVSADGAVLTSSPSSGGGQLFFDATTGKSLTKLPTGLGGTLLGFLPYGHIYCAARREAGKQTQSVLFDVKTAKVIAVLDGAEIRTVSADGKRAVGCHGGNVVVFDISLLNLK